MRTRDRIAQPIRRLGLQPQAPGGRSQAAQAEGGKVTMPLREGFLLSPSRRA